MENYLFDAFPILCWLQQEPGGDTVENLLNQADSGEITLGMNMMNLGEVYYRICRIASAKKAEEIFGKLKLLPIAFISVSDDLVIEAAKIKGRYPVSYADAFAIATAIQNKATVVTADPEYEAVAKLVKIYWLK
ncbi:MAG: type II toxin-antitoxin system VapC family toxin [Desulfobacterales bacterium]|nr:MAG: type II toxin-antitoxin system VapC family toxin [Desulfobacterales bacterium]